jgi:hypothetical protein
LRVATDNLLHGLDVRSGRVDLDGSAEAIAGLDATAAGGRWARAVATAVSGSALSAVRDRTPTRQ